MITTALIVIGILVVLYLVISVFSAILEWLAVACGVLALVVVGYVGFKYVSAALSGSFQDDIAHAAPTHTRAHEPATKKAPSKPRQESISL